MAADEPNKTRRAIPRGLLLIGLGVLAWIVVIAIAMTIIQVWNHTTTTP